MDNPPIEISPVKNDEYSIDDARRRQEKEMRRLSTNLRLNCCRREDTKQLAKRRAVARNRYEIARIAFGDAHTLARRVLPFPQNIRVICSVKCDNSCREASSIGSWCHHEGLAHLRNHGTLRVRNLDVVFSARTLYGLENIKLIGLESIALDEFCNLILNLRDARVKSISTTCTCLKTTPDMIQMLAEHGLTRITYSMHRFDSANRAITERAINAAKQAGLEPVKLNRVLLRSTIRDLPEFLGWAADKGVLLRLFSLMQTPYNIPAVAAEYVHWTDIIGVFENRIEHVEIVDFVIANRRKFIVRLFSGLRIELNLPLHLVSVLSPSPPVCQDCEFRGKCEEGLWGCGIRIGPDKRLYPCLLKPKMAFSI